MHRQFLLGLRAIADRDDGVAEAALFRPPFFAVDLADIAHARALVLGATTKSGEGAVRAEAARQWLKEVRRRRFERSPGATARALLEETAFGRFVALGPNGAQRLARLRELCLIVEQRAAAEQLDYDGVTALLREWVSSPGSLDPPPAVGVDAVQVLTVHQAKGLEFPVVVLWDSRTGWIGRNQGGAWRVHRDGTGWLLKLADVQWNEPEDQDLVRIEGDYLDQERKRIIYVAATRARDVLVLPRSDSARGQQPVNARLAEASNKKHVHTEEPYLDAHLPAWALAITPPVPPRSPSTSSPRSSSAHDGSQPPVKQRKIDSPPPPFGRRPPPAPERGHPLPGPAMAAKTRRRPFRKIAPAVSARLRHDGPPGHRHLPHLPRDDRRSRRCPRRRRERPDRAPRRSRRRSRPHTEGTVRWRHQRRHRSRFVRGVSPRRPTSDGKLLRGYADLLHVSETTIRIIDFKTDAIKGQPLPAAFPDYMEQLRAYASLLRPVAGDRRVTGALLFSATGQMVAMCE